MKTTTTVVKPTPQNIVLKEVLVSFASTDKAIAFDATDPSSKPYYSVTVFIKKDSDNHKKFLAAAKKATAGMSERSLNDMLYKKAPKLSSPTEKDEERHSGISADTHYKATFKTLAEYPPSVFDWTVEKNRVPADRTKLRIGGGDKISLQGVLRSGEHTTGSYLSTGLRVVGLLESNGAVENLDAWYDENEVPKNNDEDLLETI